MAQGVNLPIRYLAISNIYEGKDPIRVRDFHNLLGRTGRSGIYTEGNVLLTESFVYNKKNKWGTRANWKWNEYKKFIDNNNSEACSSRILKLIRPCVIDNEYNVPIYEIVMNYYCYVENYSQRYERYLENVRNNHPQFIDIVIDTINQAFFSLESIESFLMTYLIEDTWDKCEKQVHSVVKNTLAYYMANVEEKELLLQLFDSIGKYCITNVSSLYGRYICSRSMLGVKKMLFIHEWVDNNLYNIIGCYDSNNLFKCINPIIYQLLENKTVQKLGNIDSIEKIGVMWIAGKSYAEILQYSQNEHLQILSRRILKPLELDDIVKICDNVLSYDLTVILSAINEVVAAKVGVTHDVLNVFKLLSSGLKYGLEKPTEIIFYELGFGDRIVSQELSQFFENNAISISSKIDAKKQLKKYYNNIKTILEKYPSVFTQSLTRFK